MKKSTLLAVVVAVLMAVPLTLYASHQFQDVPNSHTFHTAIDFMAANGITQGCNPPANTNYCPDNPVTRGQMAGFLKRFYDNLVAGGGIGLGFAVRETSAPPDGGNGVVDGLTLNVGIPQAGALIVQGNVQMTNFVDSDALGCGINFGTPPSTVFPSSFRLVDLLNSVVDTCDTVTGLLVQPGSLPVRLVVTDAMATSEALQGFLSATLYTPDGAFGLLGTADQAFDPPAPSDIPKGTD